MTARQDWPRVRDLFHRALEQPPAARMAYVRAECSDDPALLEEVASLLNTNDHVDGFLSTPAADVRSIVDAGRQLEPGSHLGHFEIIDLVGKGGMGEVYCARDVRLDRTVAIKVLAPDLAADAVGRERFEREARLISKLSHPHICTLHDIGSASVAGDEVRFLVMEYVEGENLSCRLQRGAVPLTEALTIAEQVAAALIGAHALGIVHRDLKPSNIMLTRSGAKLLDFGLARFRADSDAAAPREDEALTRSGGMVGTLVYMSPEQVRGEAADERSDVFAFGAVVYELITGERAFTASSPTALIAAILERQPPALSERQPLAPLALERFVSTCLAKNPEERWQSARDLLHALQWVRDDASGQSSRVARQPRGRRPVLWIASAMTLIALGAASFPWWRRAQAAPQQVSFAVFAPPGTTFLRGTSEMALSPDGQHLAFVAMSQDGTRHLWLRSMNSVNARRLAGTDGAQFPFWSPDGRSIGFFAREKLMRIDTDGSSLMILCEQQNAGGGSWSSSGIILFGSDRTLHRVAASGGSPAAVTRLDQSRHERSHSWPTFLPDGRTFLYLSLTTNGEDAIYRGSLDSPDKARVATTRAGFALAGSQLFSLINRTLVVQTFDHLQGKMTGEPRQLVETIGIDVRSAQAGFAVTPNGTLAYRSVGDQSRLTWFDRDGNVLASSSEAADYHHPALAPDETRVAIEKTDPSSGRHAIWIVDFARGTTSRLVSDPFGAHAPLWSPDGTKVLFLSNRFGGLDLFSVLADGSGETLVRRSSQQSRPMDWASDGRALVYETDDDGQTDLWTLPMDAPQLAHRFFDSQANDRQGQFSPDMRWMAYASNESGKYEVYVRRYPDAGAKWRVSAHGGGQPHWRRDGKELFYLAPDGTLMATDVRASATTLESGAPHALFHTGVKGMFMDRRNHYVVNKDGRRFMVVTTDEEDVTAPITVVTNWRALNR